MAIRQAQIEGQAGMAMREAFQHAADPDFAKGHGGRNADHAGKAARAFGHAADEIGQIVKQGRGAGEQFFARGGKADPAGGALQEARAEAGF